jgi:tetratricopeptide (TPR) repeat protein
MRQNKYVKLVLAILWFFVQITLVCANDQEILSKAENHYKNRDFQKAENIYRQMHNKYPRNTKILFNLGNTYYRLGELGKAIVYYRKAQKFRPRDIEIENNLSIVKKALIDRVKQKEETVLRKLVSFIFNFSLNEYIVVGMVVWIMLNVLLVLLYIKNRGEIFRNVFWVVLMIAVFYSILLILKVRQEFLIIKGVVITKKVDIKSGPSKSMQSLFFVHEGTEFILIKKVNSWAKIKLANGFIGWMNDQDYLQI